MIVTSSYSTLAAAACRSCDWNPGSRLEPDLAVSVAARLHSERTGHSVAVLTSTVTTLRTIPDTAADQAGTVTR